MVYCFKKMRELRLTHLFFLHYALALIIGGAAITGLFVLGGGLQFYSVVVLCYMYTQPTFFLLRRMKMYEVRQEIKYGDYSQKEKMRLALSAAVFKPYFDDRMKIYSSLISINLFCVLLYCFCFNYLDVAGKCVACLFAAEAFACIPVILSFAKNP